MKASAQRATSAADQSTSSDQDSSYGIISTVLGDGGPGPIPPCSQRAPIGGTRPQQRAAAAVVDMHPRYLGIEPREYEAAYWSRYSRFDLVNCVIPVLYFGKTLTTWFSPALLTVYATVMVIKLAQAYLLIWDPSAHLRWRKGVLWAERTLRTLVSVRLVAYNPSYDAWLGRAPFMRTARVLL
ncbi:MAG: hypothetical protein J3K34DRAFT_423212 [Monoraphidium minutum]|nr:MAG: hypothetical protein J3K34DRAFT_423212 [Monoraphidium minutum]